jgi:hypothetical protein
LKSNNQKLEKHQPETGKALTGNWKSINRKLEKHQLETGKASSRNHESIDQKIEKLQPETSKASKGKHKSINQDRTKGGSITVQLTSCLTCLDQSVLHIKMKVVRQLIQNQ